MTEKQKSLWMEAKDVAAYLGYTTAKSVSTMARANGWKTRNHPKISGAYLYSKEAVEHFGATRNPGKSRVLNPNHKWHSKTTPKRVGARSKRPPIVEMDLASEVTPQVVYREPTHTMVFVPMRKLTAVMAVLGEA